MKAKPTVWLATVLVAATAGCGEAVGPEAPADPGLRTDRTAYTVEGDGPSHLRIPYEIVNRTHGPLLVQNCGGSFGVVLDRWTGEGWEQAWQRVRLLCNDTPIELAPGAVLADTIVADVGWSMSSHSDAAITGTVDGTYRIVCPELTLPDGAAPDFRHTTSNLFQVRE